MNSSQGTHILKEIKFKVILLKKLFDCTQRRCLCRAKAKGKKKKYPTRAKSQILL
jgi:hypothetical protein